MSIQQDSQHMQQFKQAQTKIMKGLQELNDLNSKYKMKTQKKFLHTFLHIMDKMSNQLVQAQEHYRNIDRQISADRKCVQLSKELNFFKSQCIELRKQLDSVKIQLHKQKTKNQILNQQSKQLTQALTKKIKLVQKYRSVSLSQGKQKNTNNNTTLKQIGWKSIDLQKQDSERKEKIKYFMKNKLENVSLLDEEKQDMIRSYRPKIDSKLEKSYVQQLRPFTKNLNRITLSHQQSPINLTQIRSSRRNSQISDLLI